MTKREQYLKIIEKFVLSKIKGCYLVIQHTNNEYMGVKIIICKEYVTRKNEYFDDDDVITKSPLFSMKIFPHRKVIKSSQISIYKSIYDDLTHLFYIPNKTSMDTILNVFYKTIYSTISPHLKKLNLDYTYYDQKISNAYKNISDMGNAHHLEHTTIIKL